MTKKSVIEVDIEDSKFNGFVKKLAAYQSMLDKMPAAWAAANKAMKGATSSNVPAAAKRTADDAKATKDAEKESLRIAKDREKAWKDMQTSSAKFAKNVAGATLSMLKWASLTGALGLLGAGGGLFGIDRLAGSVGNSRRSAQGLGLTAAQQKAFGLNFKRYVDPDSNLANIAEAKSNYANRWAFSAMGMDQRDVNKKDPAQLAVEMAIKAKEIFDRGDQSQQHAQANGLLQFYTMDELRRLHATSMKDLQESRSSYQKDAAGLDVKDEIQKTWQDFSIQMSRAGQQMENVFVKGLAPLAPQLSKLSDAFSKAVGDFLSNPKLKDWIGDLAVNVEKFSVYLGSNEFQQSMSKFVTGVGALASAVVSALEFFHIIPSSTSPKKDSPSPSPAPNQKVPGKTTYHPAWWNLYGAFDDQYQASLKRPTSTAGAKFTGDSQKYLSTLEQKYKLPSGLLDNVWLAESSRGKNMLSSAGAQGHFGFMPGTAKEYGLKDPNNFEESADAAARKFKNLLKHFDGDVEKAAAGYNWGEGNVGKQIKAYGDKWKDHLPEETRGYLPRTVGNLSPQSRTPVVIEIRNNTGGSAIVTTNQVAY